MCIMEYGDGLVDVPDIRRSKIAIFFSDDYEVIEGPSEYMIRVVAPKRSRSIRTSTKYAQILHVFLQWLDDVEDDDYSSSNWQQVDESVLYRYFLDYIESYQARKGQTPAKKTLTDYATRIVEFYRWAEKNGYPHFMEIESKEAERYITDQLLLAHLKPSVAYTKLDFNLPTGPSAIYELEINKFVQQADYEAAVRLLPDVVYSLMAVIIRTTGMRPKDILQLPYRGRLKTPNGALIPYDYDNIPDDLDGKYINYTFESKGKTRSLAFPGKLWSLICKLYIPLRRERAALHLSKYGISPRDDQLFLSEEGEVVTYGMLYYNFSRVPTLAEGKIDAQGNPVFGGKRFNARMLRHSCATYFVYEGLKLRKQLGNPAFYDASMDEELRKMLGHNDIKTTFTYYVHLVNRFMHDDLLQDLRMSHVDSGLSVMLDRLGY